MKKEKIYERVVNQGNKNNTNLGCTLCALRFGNDNYKKFCDKDNQCKVCVTESLKWFVSEANKEEEDDVVITNKYEDSVKEANTDTQGNLINGDGLKINQLIEVCDDLDKNEWFQVHYVCFYEDLFYCVEIGNKLEKTVPNCSIISWKHARLIK